MSPALVVVNDGAGARAEEAGIAASFGRRGDQDDTTLLITPELRRHIFAESGKWFSMSDEEKARALDWPCRALATWAQRGQGALSAKSGEQAACTRKELNCPCMRAARSRLH